MTKGTAGTASTAGTKSTKQIVSSGKRRKVAQVATDEQNLQNDELAEQIQRAMELNQGTQQPRFKKPTPIETERIYRMSTQGHLRNVRASKDWGRKAMERHYRDNANPPKIRTEQLSTADTRSRMAQLARTDALDGYGARTIPMTRSHIEAVSVYR